MTDEIEKPQPVITADLFEVLARGSADNELIERAYAPQWHPTTTIRKSFDDIYQLWVRQEMRLGDVRPRVIDSEWRKVPQVMGDFS